MTIFFIGIGCYFLLMVLVGWFANKRVKTMEDYLVAGRNLPFFLAMPTLVATWFGAGSCMGTSGTVYSQGFFGVIADPFGCSLALLIGGLIFAAPFRRLKLLTISDLLRKSYGSWFEKVSTLIVLPFYIGTLASQMVAMGYVFQIVCGCDLEVGICVGSVIVLFYTVFGGMWAVTLTDFIQLTMLTLGVFMVFYICFENVSDRQGVIQTFFNEFSSVIPKNTQEFDWLSYLGRLLMTGLGAIMGQDLIQRMLASRSENVARNSSIVAAILYFSISLMPLFIGIAGRNLFPDLEQPERLMPLLAKEYLSPLAFTLFACGLVSAIMSTADSYLLAGTSLVANNIFLKLWPIEEERKKIRLLRLVNIGMALMAFALSMSGQSIFDMMVHSGATLFVGIFVPVVFALFWKGANTASAWCSMIGGVVSWFGFILFNYSQLSFRHEDVLFSAAAFGGLMAFVFYAAVSASIMFFAFYTKSKRNLAATN